MKKVTAIMSRARLFLILSCLAGAYSGPAQAIENLAFYAGIVVDAKTNEVLYSHEASSKRYPASVTKVMTLYVLFSDLAAGNIAPSTMIHISDYAASARPTKLGISAGSSISVDDAIKSLVTISANDVARAIAEHLSGSEREFALRMTATARALGMVGTNYANASGWPDPDNVTTVRDQALLAIAIQQHFPQFYHYFSVREFDFAGKSYASHNNVLGYLGAVDGLKTGWTVSSGATILTSARSGDRQIVLAVFGMPRSAPRDNKVRELVSTYLPLASTGPIVAVVSRPGHPSPNRPIATTPVFPMPLPGFRLAELLAQPHRASDDHAPHLAGEPTLRVVPGHDIIGRWLVDYYQLGEPPAPLGETLPSLPIPTAP